MSVESGGRYYSYLLVCRQVARRGLLLECLVCVAALVHLLGRRSVKHHRIIEPRDCLQLLLCLLEVDDGRANTDCVLELSVPLFTLAFVALLIALLDRGLVE